MKRLGVLAIALSISGAALAQDDAYVSVGEPPVRLATRGSECEVTREELARLAPEADVAALEQRGDLRVLAVLYPCLAVQRLRLRGEVLPYTGHSTWMQLATTVSGVSRQGFIDAMARQYAVPSDGITTRPFDEARADAPTMFARDRHGVYGVMLSEVRGVRICAMMGMTIVDGRAYGRYDYRPCTSPRDMDEFGLWGWSEISGLLARTPEHQFSNASLPTTVATKQEDTFARVANAGLRGAAGGIVFAAIVGLIFLLAWLFRRRRPE